MPQKNEKNKNKNNTSNRLFKGGLLLIAASLVVLGLLYYPVIFKEISYVINKPNVNSQVVLKSDNYVEITSVVEKKKIITPIDEDFGIVIPKISANAKIIENVDPYNSQEYQQKLTQGVAHAKGTSLPDKSGNMFLFAHSSDSFLNATKYNSIFYLLNKLEKGDEIYILYQGTKYVYNVDDVVIVSPTAVNYLDEASLTEGYDRTVTLMTCWPAGTTLKRLIVVASQKSFPQKIQTSP